MRKTKVVIALIVSMTADAVSKADDLSLEPLDDSRSGRAGARVAQVAGGLAQLCPAAARAMQIESMVATR